MDQFQYSRKSECLKTLEGYRGWTPLRIRLVVVATMLCFMVSTFESNASARLPQIQTPGTAQEKPLLNANQNSDQKSEQKPQVELDPISTAANPGDSFDQDFAFTHLVDVCAIGNRMSTSPGMVKQQQYLNKHFKAIGGTVKLQGFTVPDPRTRVRVRLDNLIVRFHPERARRLLFCCHYDTRPFPDRDGRNPQGLFVGANDGGSGVGLLCELGRHMKTMEGRYGIDIIFFDGEEFVFQAKRDPMFLGSNFFANQYAAGKYDVRYEYAVLVDMVGDAKLQLKIEQNSLNMAGRLTNSIWGVAREMGVKEFIPRVGHTIRDDHLPLNMIAGIQTCDIIDFDYPTPQSKNAFWHTTKDSVENCSADSLGKVGSVLLEWTRQMQKLNGGK